MHRIPTLAPSRMRKTSRIRTRYSHWREAQNLESNWKSEYVHSFFRICSLESELHLKYRHALLPSQALASGAFPLLCSVRGIKGCHETGVFHLLF